MTDRFHRRRHIYGAVAFAFLLLTLGQLAMPVAAPAQIPNPVQLLPGGGIPGLDPSQWVVDGFKALLEWIFGDKLDDLGKNLVKLLLALPLITDTKAFPDLNEYRGYVTGGAWGILGLSFVVATVRYWLSGYSGNGAYEALTGFVKTVVAIAILLMFPIVFDQVLRFANAMTAALIDPPVVERGLSKGMVGTISTAPITDGGMQMLLAIVAIVLAMVLLVVKVIITALMAVLFVASPLAIALYPIEEAAWLMRTLLQSLAALAMFPILWAVSFATFAVLNTDAMFPGGNGDLMTSILSPLIVLASLVIAFKLPFAVLQQAMNAGISPGMNRGITVITNVQKVVPSGRWARPTPGMKN